MPPRRSRLPRRGNLHRGNTDTNCKPFLSTTLHKDTTILRCWKRRHLPTWIIKNVTEETQKLIKPHSRKTKNTSCKFSKSHHYCTSNNSNTWRPDSHTKTHSYLTIPQHGHCHPGVSWISDPRKQFQSQEARPGPRRDNKYRPEEDVSQWPPPGTKHTGGVLDQLTL